MSSPRRESISVRAILPATDSEYVHFRGDGAGLVSSLLTCGVLAESRRDGSAWLVPRAAANDVVTALRLKGATVEVERPEPMRAEGGE